MTRKNFLIILTLSLLFSASALQAQDLLTLEAAMQQAMAHNHGIVVARNNAQMAENNATPGNAGLLPQLGASGSYTYSNSNTNLIFAGNNPPIEVNGAESTTLNGSVGLTYTLFDGLGNIHTLRKLEATSTVAGMQERLIIEQTVIQVVSMYYEIARLQEALEVAKESMFFSRDRYKRAKARNEFGGNNALQLLNAEVNMNADSVNIMNAERGLANAKRNLNFMMGKSGIADYSVETEVTLTTAFDEAELMAQARKNNANVLITTSNLLVSEYDLKIARSARYPRVGLNGSYGYTNQQNEASFILENRNTGFTGGVSVNFNIFDGRRLNTRIENAQLAIANNQQQLAQTELQIDRDVQNAYANYLHSIRVIDLEAQNVETAKLNFERSQEQFDAGIITTTQMREAQLNLVNARNRSNNARFSAKLAEMELRRLRGDLVTAE